MKPIHLFKSFFNLFKIFEGRKTRGPDKAGINKVIKFLEHSGIEMVPRLFIQLHYSSIRKLFLFLLSFHNRNENRKGVPAVY